MRLFQCGHCGCCENTALASQGFLATAEYFDWTSCYSPMPKGVEQLLCSACGPSKYSDGTPTKYGKWHGRFDRVFLPVGMFKTAQNGNLEHVDTGDQDFIKYRIGV